MCNWYCGVIVTPFSSTVCSLLESWLVPRSRVAGVGVETRRCSGQGPAAMARR